MYIYIYVYMCIYIYTHTHIGASSGLGLNAAKATAAAATTAAIGRSAMGRSIIGTESVRWCGSPLAGLAVGGVGGGGGADGRRHLADRRGGGRLVRNLHELVPPGRRGERAHLGVEPSHSVSSPEASSPAILYSPLSHARHPCEKTR